MQQGGGWRNKDKGVGKHEGRTQGHDRKTDGRTDGMEWPARTEKGEIT